MHEPGCMRAIISEPVLHCLIGQKYTTEPSVEMVKLHLVNICFIDAGKLDAILLINQTQL